MIWPALSMWDGPRDMGLAINTVRHEMCLGPPPPSSLGGAQDSSLTRPALTDATSELARWSARFFTNATRAHQRPLRACSVVVVPRVARFSEESLLHRASSAAAAPRVARFSEESPLHRASSEVVVPRAVRFSEESPLQRINSVGSRHSKNLLPQNPVGFSLTCA